MRRCLAGSKNQLRKLFNTQPTAEYWETLLYYEANQPDDYRILMSHKTKTEADNSGIDNPRSALGAASRSDASLRNA